MLDEGVEGASSAGNDDQEEVRPPCSSSYGHDVSP